ncbi:hypothetical protein KBD45_06830 [Candidatus Dojkabacteria bacterium]|nr:hypothetical protein [Candidatus Dojkabacteria bacterium]
MPERKLGPQVDIYGVINDAREALLQKSHDVAHGVEHHQNVADNVDYIVNAEGIKQEINYDALKVAAWWHDYDRHSADYSVMTNSLEKHGANPGFIDEVIKIIDGHSNIFGSKTVEQELLFLADKIEYVDVNRYKQSILYMDPNQLGLSFAYWNLKIRPVIFKINRTKYKSAKDLFYNKLDDLVGYIGEYRPEDLHWFKGLI